MKPVLILIALFSFTSLYNSSSIFKRVSDSYSMQGYLKSEKNIEAIYPACKLTEFLMIFQTYNVTSKYIVTPHYTRADDGYDLLMFRIRLSDSELSKLPQNKQENIKQPVMMQHGLTSSSDDWFDNGLNNSLGFHIANQGYDVWVGNNRGNKYSKTVMNNTNITEQDFYNYSFTELGLGDQKSFWEHILSLYPNNPDQKIYYFGHSQGTSQMFVSLTDVRSRDFFNKHMKRFFALAPIVYLNHVTKFGLAWLSQWQKVIDYLSKVIHVYVLAEAGCTKNNEWNVAKDYQCKTNNFLCNQTDNYPWVDRGVDNIGKGIKSSHDPSGSSTKCFDHYAQIIDGGWFGRPVFRPYNYGWFLNLSKYYGSVYPPEWDQKEINSPLSLLAGALDELGTPENEKELTKVLKPNSYTIDTQANYTHESFTSAIDNTPLFNAVDKLMENDKNIEKNSYFKKEYI